MHSKLTDKVREATSAVPNIPWLAKGPQALDHDVLVGLVQATGDGITVLDSDYRFVYANPAACELLGYPLDRLLGQDRRALLSERQRQTYLTFLDKARGGKSAVRMDIIYRPDGSEVEVELRATVLDLQGKQFIATIFRDVTERHRQARRAAALAQAARSVAVSDSIAATLDAICECALSGTRALAAWVRLNEEDQAAAWVGAAGVPDGFRERLRPAASVAAAACAFVQALSAQRVLVYADARQQVERQLGTADLTGALKSLPWQAGAFAPVLYRGAVVGLLAAIYREDEVPYEAETSFLAALADEAALAAAQVLLLQTAREKVALEERQRLARELHDSVCQSLYAIQLGAQTAFERLDQDPTGVAQPIDRIKHLAEASQAEMRALIFALRPEALESEGLVAALNRQVEAIRARHGIAAQTITSAEPELPIEVKQALYRIGQEALWNLVKHAHAGRVDVRLEADGATVVLEIADDGVGFDPDGSFPGHLGLRCMRERASGVGGSLEVVSDRDRGTRVVVRVPSPPQSPPRRERSPEPHRTRSSGTMPPAAK